MSEHKWTVDELGIVCGDERIVMSKHTAAMNLVCIKHNASIAAAREKQQRNNQYLASKEQQLREQLATAVEALEAGASMLHSIHKDEHNGDCAGDYCPTFVIAKKLDAAIKLVGGEINRPDVMKE